MKNNIWKWITCFLIVVIIVVTIYCLKMHKLPGPICDDGWVECNGACYPKGTTCEGGKPSWNLKDACDALKNEPANAKSNANVSVNANSNANANANAKK